MAIYSCKGCVAPKRHPGCHSSCEEYLKEKAEYERKKAEEEKRRKIEYGLDSHIRRYMNASRKIHGQKG
jgi:hypothetical protein